MNVTQGNIWKTSWFLIALDDLPQTSFCSRIMGLVDKREAVSVVLLRFWEQYFPLHARELGLMKPLAAGQAHSQGTAVHCSTEGSMPE